MRPLGRSPGELSDALYSGMFPMLPFANCIRDNRFTFEGRHEVTANMTGTQLNFHGSGWQSPWLRGRYDSMFRHDRGQLVAMPFGRIRRVRRFPALICPQREPWRGRLQPLTIRSTPSNPFRRVGSDVAGERIVRARSMCLAVSRMPGIPAAVCPSSKTSTTRRSKCSLRRMACCGRRQRWAGSPGEIRL